MIRVTVRFPQYNPRPFIVRDPAKIARWMMQARQSGWKKGTGIRIAEEVAA